MRISVEGRDPDLVAAGARLAATHVDADSDRPLSRAELLHAFSALAPSGYLGSTVPAAAGGAGLSHVAFGSLVEGVGSVAPFLSNHSVQRSVHAAGSPAARAFHLPALLAGTAIGAIAITEPHGGSQVADLRTTLREVGDGYVLEGTKTWVVHGMVADVVMVLARGPTGTPVRVLVDAESPEVRRTAIPTSGLRYLTFAALEFDRCPVGPDAVLAGDGVEATKQAFGVARALVAVQAVALAQTALDATIRHLATRRARGREVTGLDLVRHRIGALAGSVAAARLFCYRSLAAIDGAEPGAEATAAGAKAHATDIARVVCGEVLELCAAAGLEQGTRVVRCRDDAAMLATADGTAVVNHTIWGAHVVRETLSRAE